MQHRFSFTLLTLLAIFSFSSFAEDKSSGCGLGKMVFSKNSLVSTTGARIIDYFIPLQPSATTSGTSGCAKHDLVQLQVIQEHFIASNYEVLRMQTAFGHGEELDIMAATFGCNKESKGEFFKALQENPALLESESSRDFFLTVKKIQQSNPALKNNCKVQLG